jgi:hypothetical protein
MNVVISALDIVGILKPAFRKRNMGGYNYEHCFSYDWNAMKGYHCLMRIGHALNVLVQYSEKLVQFVKDMGKKGFIGYIFESIRVLLLDKAWLKNKRKEAYQIRLL